MTPAQSPHATLTALAAHGLLGLLDEVCARRGVTREEVCSRQRTRAVTAARHELWHLIRQLPERHYSFPEIARLFRRDPSSVLHGVAAHRQRVRAAAPLPR